MDFGHWHVFLTQEKLNKLKRYLDLTDKDVENLRKIKERLTFQEVYSIFKKFSEHLLTFEEFRKIVEERQIDLHELRLKRTRYFFRLLENHYDREYVESRIKVGVVHSSARITIDYFIGGVGKLLEIVEEKLKEKFSPQELPEVFTSLVKAFLFDVAIIIDSYIYETFEKFKEFLERNVDAIVLLDYDFKVVFANRTFEKLVGVNREELRGVSFCELFPKEKKTQCAYIREVCKSRESGTIEEIVYLENRKTGVRIPVELAFNRYRVQEDTYFVLDIRNVSEKLEFEKEYLRLAALHTVMGEIDRLLFSERDYKKILYNFVKILVEHGGFKFAGIYRDSTGNPVVEYGTYNASDYAVCLKSFCNGGCVILVLAKEEEHFYKSEINFIQEILNDIVHTVETSRIHEKLTEVSLYDPLTGLPNRNLFINLVQDLIRRVRLKGRKVAIVVFDIDSFTEINTVYGQKVGDEILKEVARRITLIPEITDYVARITGDTFAFALEYTYSKDEVVKVINEIRRIFSEPVFVNSYEIYVTFSFGISVFPDDGESPEELLSYATTAMLEARKIGGNTYSFYRFPEFELKEKMKLKQDLKKAVEKGDFILLYQPKISLRERKVVGAEALLRWKRGDELISPALFISILEETGLINEVGMWVMKEVCRQLREWQEKDLNFKIAVNISPVQLRSTSHIRNLMRKIRSCKLLLSYLEVEITETAVMENIGLSSVFLRSLSDLGVKSYIDDFGTGYSSLAYLKKLPVYGLKIDVGFVRNIPEDRDNLEIVKTIISLAKSFGLKVVAEGVEKKIQEEILLELGCDYAQGFYYSPPLRAEEFERFAREFEEKGSAHRSGI